MQQSPSIADVAQLAGVSVSTVSRVLNDKTDVSEATRRTVSQVIERLGYERNHSAVSLVQQSSRTIAMLFPSDSVPLESYELEYVSSAAEATADRDYFFNFVTRQLDEGRL